MRVLNRLILLVIFTTCVYLGFKFLNTNLQFKNIPEDGYVFLVKKNQTLKGVAFDLKKANLVQNDFLPFLVLRVLVGNKNLSSGEYLIAQGDNILNLAFKIKNKKYYYRKVTFVEGNTLQTYVLQIQNLVGIEVDELTSTTEGYFMPGTYFYLYGEKASDLIKRARKEMIEFVNEEFAKVENKKNFYLKNVQEVITLASVVEKETGVSKERGLIAGVFYNRLKKNMRLQSDPTTVYELTKGKKELGRSLTRKDLYVVGSYNTYRIGGLPAGPIASPGKQSILAVLNPKKTDYVFFVANGEGGHFFSVTFDEHKKNIQRYKKILKQNE